MYCINCGAKILNNHAKFCPKCGYPVGQNDSSVYQEITSKPEKNKFSMIGFFILGALASISVIFLFFMKFWNNAPETSSPTLESQETVASEVPETYEEPEIIQDTSPSEKLPSATLKTVEISIPEENQAVNSIKLPEYTTPPETVPPVTEKAETPAPVPETIPEPETVPAPIPETEPVKIPSYTEDLTSKFSYATASSVLSPINADHTTYTYEAYKAIDGDKTTCWCEGANGNGENEYLYFESDNWADVSEIVIYNGLYTSRDLFYKNNRVKECSISFSDGSFTQVVLDGDYDNQPCVIKLDEPICTNSIQITINSTYSGNKYTDTCISEVKIKGGLS